MEKLSLKIECRSCGGTGIYKGMAERGSAGVICKTCSGTGCEELNISYTPFTHRVITDKVKRVYLSNYGYCISDTYRGNFERNSKEIIDMSKEGISYEDFLKGVNPKHIKKLVCPVRANNFGNINLSKFDKFCVSIPGNRFCECPKADRIEECWELFEKLNKE
jgi:hypothetical protein